MARDARFNGRPYVNESSFHRRLPGARRQYFLGWILAGAAVLATLGCNRTGLQGTIPIRGKVIHQGKPLTTGEVRYSPVDDNGRPARGDLQPDGTFQLTTLAANDGALPGEYRVVVLAYKPHPGEPGRGDVPADAPPPTITREPLVPEKYTDPDQTPFRDTVNGAHPGFKEWTVE